MRKKKKDKVKKIKEKPKKTKLISISFEKGVKQAEDIIKKDAVFVKKEAAIIKKEIKKYNFSGFFSFLLTYGWAIMVIIAGVYGFYWWQNYSVASEYCEFPDGSGILCENFDITNESIKLELRNLNNKSIKITQISTESCSLISERDVPKDDKRQFKIDCNTTKSRFKGSLNIEYTIDDFEKHAVGRIVKLIK